MDTYKDFNGMDLNVKEREICRDKPFTAIQMYRRRTGLGLMDARNALENELGMDFRTYREVKERIAFSLYYQEYVLRTCKGTNTEKNLLEALRSWRVFKRTIKESENDSKFINSIINGCYKTAEMIIDVMDREFDRDYYSIEELSEGCK